MFIFNIKLNKYILVKAFLIFCIILISIILIYVMYKIFYESSNSNSSVSDYITSPEIAEISSSNYTNVLKAVHDDMNSYLNKKIKLCGYVYRVYDIQDNEFIIARNMIINSNLQTLVVGFLCSAPNASDFTDGTWIELTGTLTKGIYHNEIPIIQAETINTIEKPSDEFVYPPDSSYIPTSGIL